MRSLLLASILAATVVGCGGTTGRLIAAERLPANGTPGGPGEAALKLQMIGTKDWAEIGAKKLKPSCAGANVDAAAVAESKKILDAWQTYRKAHPPEPEKKGVTVGDLAGIQRDITRRIESFTFACGPGAVLEVNNVGHQFDSAYVITDRPKGTEMLGILAVSMADKKMVYAGVTIPSAADLKIDPKKTADEVSIVTSFANYVPATPDEPMVQSWYGETSAPLLETLIAGKGTTEGFYFLVPLHADLSAEQYVGVGKFKVGDN